jgi:hypothetical protein
MYLMALQLAGKAMDQLHFADYIRLFPSAWIFEHFLKKSNGPRRILSSTAIQERVRHFSQTDSLRRQFEELDQQRKLLCSLVYLQGERGFAVPEQSGDPLNDPLVRSFLVYAARRKDGIVRYFGFPEFRTALRQACAKTIVKAAVAKGRIAAVSQRNGQCFRDVATVATLALQGVLEKKKQGGLTRNALLKIARLTHEESDGLADLLIHCGTNAGILLETDESFVCATENFEAWLERPEAERTAALVTYAAEFAGSWNLELLREILRQADGEWLSCAVFPAKERKEAIDVLRILRWAGIVDISKTGSETVFGARREKGSVHAPSRPGETPEKKGAAIMILPDFTVVITQEAAPQYLYRFSRVGTFVSLDRVYKGAIDRSVLNNALAAGFKGTTLIAWLESWLAPPNVVATVREWVREFYRVYITEGAMLVATDEKVAFEVGSPQGPLHGYLEQVPAHTLFRIRRGAEATVNELLHTMGFDYRMPGGEIVLAAEPKVAEQPAVTDRWEPVVTAAVDLPKQNVPFRGKKYGSGLKTFDLNEMLHVIDYAVLTGHDLALDYAGSPLVRKGNYAVTPLSRTRGAEPVLEGNDRGRKKQFLIRKISRIGVGAQ